jgi:hypothetical protein
LGKRLSIETPPVLGVPAADKAIDHEAVRLQDIDRIESRPLRGEVAEVDAVGAIGADRVQLLELGLEAAPEFDIEPFPTPFPPPASG